MVALALSLLIIAPPPAPPPEPERAVASWTCFANEQVDQHVSGMLEMIVTPDGRRASLSYYVNWSQQPHYIAEQQMRWVWIPLDATKLWKPDEIGLSVRTERDDDRGSVAFDSPEYGRLTPTGRGTFHSLRPTFHATWVSVGDAYLMAHLWAEWRWKVILSDRKGMPLGSQEILLPGPEQAQAMFARLRAELDRRAQAPAANCTPNLEPTQQEIDEQSMIVR
jgi:hypothetical protein